MAASDVRSTVVASAAGVAALTGAGVALAAILQRLKGGMAPGVLRALLQGGGSLPGDGEQPVRPAHCPLRPDADPRLDQSMYVRYDPPAARKTGAIVIVVPGGNYDSCDVNSGEGQPIAQWLVGLGITAIVLRYRLVSQGHYWPAQFEDWQECARQVKAHAASWDCDPGRVGVIGFSAGGHLAAFAANRAEAELRPALQILVYPSIDTLTPRKDGDIDPWFPQRGYPSPDTSCHHLVHGETPQAFLAGIRGDRYCPADENTDVYAEALTRHGVGFRYVTDGTFQHGCGLQDWWTKDCERWLEGLGWALPADAA